MERRKKNSTNLRETWVLGEEESRRMKVMEQIGKMA